MKQAARRLTLALYNIDESYCLSEKKRRISRAELNVMYALDDGAPHSQAELSRDWLVPKTTVNTIIKRWERLGYLVQTPVPGKRREMQITLTDRGKEYVGEFTEIIRRAEDTALRETVRRYSGEFIEAVEYFGKTFREAFEGAERERRS